MIKGDHHVRACAIIVSIFVCTGSRGSYICDPLSGEEIPLRLLCNGFADCQSGEDETTSICDSELSTCLSSFVLHLHGYNILGGVRGMVWCIVLNRI